MMVDGVMNYYNCQRTKQMGISVCLCSLKSRLRSSGRNPQYLHVELSEVVVQNPTGQTAKAQVGAEARRTGIQRAHVDPRVLKVGHPHLHRQRQWGHSSDHLMKKKANWKCCGSVQQWAFNASFWFTFLSRCLLSLSKASDSPPCQIAGGKPSVLKPGQIFTWRHGQIQSSYYLMNQSLLEC